MKSPVWLVSEDSWCAVTLTLDNPDGRLSVDTPEVEITRRLDRDGESSFLINQNPARLKDIRELLLDTGLGVGGYSFMGQGRIDAILNVRWSKSLAISGGYLARRR